MKYQHRWYYVAIIIISAIALLIVTSATSATRLFELKHAAIILEQKLAVLSRASTTVIVERQTEVNDKQLTSYTVLPTLTELAGLSELMVDDAKLMPPVLPTIKHWKVRINVHGNYQQITDYFSRLSAQSFAVLLLNFSYRSMEQNKLKMEAELVVLINHAAAHEKEMMLRYVEGRQPFCHGLNTVVTSQPTLNELTAFSRQQLRMVGYYHLGQESQALIQLPNNHVVAVKVGDKVGTDAGTVAEIKQSMLVVNAGGIKQIMTMRSLNE